MKRNLILASNSPRRRELLKELYAEYTVQPSSFEERTEERDAEKVALLFAEGKARDVFKKNPQSVVVGADTVVALDGEILGKPASEEEARRMLSSLSGRTHRVITGYCVLCAEREYRGVERSEVEFFPLSEKQIEDYIATGSPMDKAGAYGIQDGGLVRRYSGSYTNIIGFPTEIIGEILRQLIKEGILS